MDIILIIKLSAILLVVAFFFLNKDIFIIFLKKIVAILLAPTGALKRIDFIKKDQMRALITERNHKKFLLYRTYKRKKGEQYGVYTLANYRKGFIIKVNPGPYLGEELENILGGLFSRINTNNISMQFTTFASSNIEELLNWHEELHGKADEINIDGARAISKLQKAKRDFFRKKTKESLLKDYDGDFRVRHLINLISVTVSKDLPKHKMDELYTTIVGSLASLKPTEFNGIELVTMGQEIFNSSKDKYDVEEIESFSMNDQMTMDSTVSLTRDLERGREDITFDDLTEKDGTIKISDDYVKNYTIKSFPRNTSLFAMQSALFDPFGKDFLITIPSSFLATFTLAFDNVEKDTQHVKKKAQWNIKQLGYVPPIVEDRNPILAKKREEFTNIVAAIDEHDAKITRGSFHIIIKDKDKQVVESAGSRLIGKFKNLKSGKLELREENSPMINFMGFLYSMPLMYSSIYKQKSDRFNLLVSLNNAKLAPIYSDFKGLNMPIMLSVGRTGEAQYLSFKGDAAPNPNFTLVGPPGTGKSSFLNEFISSSLDAGDIVRSIDLGNSQEPLCKNVAKGQFENFFKGKCLNFFTHIETHMVKQEDGSFEEEIHPDELETIVPLIGRMLRITLSSSSSSSEQISIADALKNKQITVFVENALRTAFKARGRNAGMQEVYESLLALSEHYKNLDREDLSNFIFEIAVALEDYVIVKETNGERIGKYVTFFNGANNLNIIKDYFVLELMKVVDKSKDFSSIVIMGVLNKMAQEAYERQDVFKWYLIDEAKEPLKDPLFSHFLDNFALRIRKYKGGLGIATQSTRHFFESKEAAGVFETASYKVFLEQDDATIEELIQEGKISLNGFTKELMKSITFRDNKFSEFMVLQSSKVMIGRLFLDPYTKWLTTTKPDEKDILKQIEKEYNIERDQSAEFMKNREIFPEITDTENINRVLAS